MQKYLFVFGKNAKLSEMELDAFCRSRGIKLEKIERTDFVLVAEGNFDPKLLAYLGGTVKIGEVAGEIEVPANSYYKKEKEEMEGVLDESGAAGFFSSIKEFGVSIYPNAESDLKKANWGRIANQIGSYFKNKLGGEFIVSTRREPWLNAVEVNKQELVGKNLEILVGIGENTTYFCKTAAVYNPFEFEKRDTWKFGRELLSEVGIMPPKLARIMVNLSETKEGETLLDPFCGSGTILCEALLCGINAFGTDINAKCVEAAAKNVEKTKETHGLGAKGKAIIGDARKLPLSDNQIDGIATEPYLGKLLWKTPTALSVGKSVKELRKLYAEALIEMRRVLKSGRKIVFIAPVFNTKKGYQRLLMDQILKTARLKPVNKVLESRESQKVLREIWILEK